MSNLISKSALLAEIERLVNNYDKALDYEAALEDVRDFIDSLEVKELAENERDKGMCKENGNSLTQEPANEDLEKAAVEAFKQIVDSDKNNFLEIFKAGAKFQAEQFEKNRLAACDRQAEEEAEIERDFIDSHEVKESAELQHVDETCKENGNSLTQEPVNEDLETFAKRESEVFAEREYEIDYYDRNALGKGYYWGCIDGAKWQAEQFEKNRLAACDRQAEEEAEIERDFVMGIIENEHRQPTYDDAIKYGMRLQKEQMMAKAVDGEVTYGKSLAIPSLGWVIDKERLDYGDKVKLIIIKQD